MNTNRLGSRSRKLVVYGLIAAVVLSIPISHRAEAQQPSATWDVTQPRGKTREIDFTTTEGTWMSVDISPDGRWIVFDLLAHIYRVPIEGGEAECLTEDSGIAVNFHPRYSPDGKYIAFVSDRKGQNNLWIMEADGSNPRPVFTDPNVRVVTPTWTPDGEYIIVRRQTMGDRLHPPTNGLWMYHRDGGEGVELVGNDVPGAAWPSISPDGKYLYFHVFRGDRRRIGWDALRGSHQIWRLTLRTGELIEITTGEAQQQIRSSSGGAYAPEISPDGRWLAFARRIPDGTISYKGHRFGPRTALWLRDMKTGAERVIMDPIDVDMVETIKTLRVLPGYSWSPDGSFIVISQGGKLRRLDVTTGNVTTIPFTARVHRTISEMARNAFRISDDPFLVRFIRWPTASPDGKRLVFQAVGKIWIMDLPDGTPRRLTPASFEPFEFAPAWSPDGQWIAFTSWDEKIGGHLWKVPASGGVPERLTEEPGEYIHPVWSPDGQYIVLARGSGATARGRTWVANPWYDLVRVPATGGAATFVIKVTRPTNERFFSNARRQIVRPAFGPEGRIFYPERVRRKMDGEERTVTAFVSVRPDGSDKRTHLVFPFADEVVPSPDGKWVAFQEGDNVYLVPFPWAGAGGEPITINKKKSKLPVKPLSSQGGLFPRWRDARTVEFGSGNTYFVYHLDTERTETIEIHLLIPRDIPKGTIALVGARIITLNHRRVIERGTLVVRGSRIVCVGDCDTTGVDRIIDVSGKTIIPGFVDMHAHHYREHRGIIPAHNYETAIYLAYGVTTNLDNSTWSQNVFSTAELIEAGAVIGPRTFSTGDPLYRGDGPRQNEITSYEVAEDNIKRLASWGAVSLKQYLQPRRDQRQWITDIARKLGLTVTAEGGSLVYNLSMVMDGHTGFEHPLSYGIIYSDVAKFLGQAGIVYSPTFVVGGMGPWNEEYFFQERDLWKDEKLRRFTPWRQLIPHTRRRMLRPKTDYSFPLIAQALADIIAEGGYGAIGSHGQQHGIASHWEVWMAASALGPMGALEVASLHGAHFLGAEQDIGSIEVGKLADLMVLNANPLDDIHNTLDILYVMKGGKLYDAETLDEIWPESKPFGEYYWVDPDALRSDNRPVDYWDHRSRRRR